MNTISSGLIFLHLFITTLWLRNFLGCGCLIGLRGVLSYVREVSPEALTLTGSSDPFDTSVFTP